MGSIWAADPLLTDKGQAVAEEISAWTALVPTYIRRVGIQNLPGLADELIPRKDGLDDPALVSRRNKQARQAAGSRGRDVAEREGWGWEGGGTVRLVFDPVDEHVMQESVPTVVKIAKGYGRGGFMGAQDQMITEITNWELAPPETKDDILPVYQWDREYQEWLLTARAGTNDPRLTDEQAEQVHGRLIEHGWGDAGDLDAGNIGVVNDRVVAIDTGILFVGSDMERREFRADHKGEFGRLSDPQLANLIAGRTGVDPSEGRR